MRCQVCCDEGSSWVAVYILGSLLEGFASSASFRERELCIHIYIDIDWVAVGHGVCLTVFLDGVGL